MIITSVSLQAKNKDRVNIFVDGKYRFSLDVFQLSELGVRVNREYSEAELAAIEHEGQFGKLYSRALMYAMSRPHSEKETRDYLRRVSLPRRKKDGELSERLPEELSTRVLARLLEKGYVNDENFVRFWVENRQVRKGISQRKLAAELSAKGIDQALISDTLAGSERGDRSEIHKVIAKKAGHYDDEQKLIAYLARQGFRYDDIKAALSEPDDGSSRG